MSQPAPTTEHRAQILWESDPSDRKRIEALRDDPAVSVVDHSDSLREQHSSLLPLSSKARSGESAADDLPWVHYPWRHTITRLLGPAEHRDLRLDRNRNKITRREQQQLGALKIGVVGLSVGHAIAHTLVLEGLCGALRLADFDTIELSNLNRIPASVLDIGVNKAVVVARRIAELDPYLPVELFTDGLTDDNLAEFFDGLDLVVEECDSLDIKLKVRLEARRRGIPVLMETSDRGLFDVERFDQESERPLFHGLLGDVDPSSLKGLSTRDKAPHVMRILEAVDLSPRMAASMVEIDRTLNTWPQLGGDVQLGAATVAAAVRRLGRGDALPSGRIRIDLDEQLRGLAAPSTPVHHSGTSATSLADTIPVDAEDAVVQAIRLAPSGGNIQPWRIRQSAGEFQIDLEPARTSAMDIGFRGSYVGIGAASLNARVALAAHGFTGTVVFGDPTPQDRLAVTITAVQAEDSDLASIYPAMRHRISNRNPGRRNAIAPRLLQDLLTAAEQEGGRLRLLTEQNQLATAADILAASDRIRYLTPLLHAQMMSELKWPGIDRLESGIDVRTLGLDDADLAKLRVAERADVMSFLRTWDGGHALGDNTRDRVLGSSALAVITVDGDLTADYLRGGAAMQRVWITAQLHELGVAPISPVFLYARTKADLVEASPHFAAELGELQQRFFSLIEADPRESVILAMRISHGVGPTPRSERLPREQIMADTSVDNQTRTQEKLD